MIGWAIKKKVELWIYQLWRSGQQVCFLTISKTWESELGRALKKDSSTVWILQWRLMSAFIIVSSFYHLPFSERRASELLKAAVWRMTSQFVRLCFWLAINSLLLSSTLFPGGKAHCSKVLSIRHTITITNNFMSLALKKPSMNATFRSIFLSYLSAYSNQC